MGEESISADGEVEMEISGPIMCVVNIPVIDGTINSPK
jgi:hypothetical protein